MPEPVPEHLRSRREALIARRSSLPDPVLRAVHDATPFAHFRGDKMGPGRRFHDVVVVKGSFSFADGVLDPRGGPGPIALADVYRAPERAPCTSVATAGDLVLYKPAADVFVTGAARPPAGRPATRWDAAVVVRDRHRTLASLALEVTGPRRWEHRAMRGLALSDPEAAHEVPVQYELAYGGGYPHRRDPERFVLHAPNPSGTGFFDVDALDRDTPIAGPQWQTPDAPVSKPNVARPLAGFGPIARSWESRVRFAGTYDGAWRERVRLEAEAGLPPDYAADFDLRFFQCAHPSLTVDRHLRGDERIGLRGLVGAESDVLLDLPGVGVVAELEGPGGTAPRSLLLDTVHVDLDAAAVHLTWRLTLDQREGIESATLTTSRVGDA